MKDKRYTYSAHTVHNIKYHLIWCPKYRRRVLVGDIEKRLRELLREKAADIGIHIVEMEVMSNHVHVFVHATPVDSPHYIVQQFKGFSSRLLRKEFPSLKSRLPTLWTRSYFCESVGHISEHTIKQYIIDQKKH